MESRAVYFIIAGLLVLFVALQGVLIAGAEPGITRLKVAQDKGQIKVSWKDQKGADAYLIRVEDQKTDETKVIKTSELSCSVPCDDIPGKYRVSVRSVGSSKGNSDFPTAQSETIKLRKYSQKIKLENDNIVLVEGEKEKVKAKATGDISYDTDSEVIDVTDKGTVKAVSPGKTELKVCAEGGTYYSPEEKTVTVTVFPDELDTPKVKIKEKNEFDAVLTWDEVPYATSYEIYKGSSEEPFMETEEREAEVLRSSAGYRIKAKVKAGDEYVWSPYSDPAKMDTYVDEAPSYSSPYLLKTFDSSDLEEIASIPCAGSAGAPQSFSYTGKDYIVTYEDRSLAVFGKDAKEKDRVSMDMSRPNGSTYANGRVYIVHTSSTCSIYNTETGNTGSVRIPRVTSGIAYDASINRFYLSGGPKVLITDEQFNATGKIMKVRSQRAQDIGAGDGVVLVAIWTGSTNFVDVYRTKDLKYIGGYEIPFGEIESVTSVDKHLVFLMHNTLFNGTRAGKILRTKDRLPIS
ncbi:MAG: hypothetical protein IKF07_04170 [Eubacterium sp.]|nr:hypothetical protein [Eubacterium sp.]